MFEGFTEQRIDTGELTINLRVGGSGPPVLLLHGWPQHWYMWRDVLPGLIADHRVIAPDLRVRIDAASMRSRIAGESSRAKVAKSGGAA